MAPYFFSGENRLFVSRLLGINGSRDCQVRYTGGFSISHPGKNETKMERMPRVKRKQERKNQSMGGGRKKSGEREREGKLGNAKANTLGSIIDRFHWPKIS